MAEVSYDEYFGAVGKRVKSTWELGERGTVVAFNHVHMSSRVEWDAGYITLCTPDDIEPAEEY